MNPVGTKEQREELRQERMAFLSPTEREFALDGLDIAEEMAEALEAEAESLSHDAECDDCDRRRDESTDVHASNCCPESLRLGSHACDLRRVVLAKWDNWQGK